MTKKSFRRVLLGALVVAVAMSFHAVAYAEVTIRYATYFTPSYKEHHQGMNKFVDFVNEKGKGKVKVEFYHSETLIKADQLFSGLMVGAAEAVSVPMVYWHGTLPLSQGLSLPVIWKGDMERYHRSLAYGSPIANFLNENFAKKNLFAFYGVIEDEEWLWTRSKLVKTPGDIKGQKIRAPGLIPSEVIQRIGASPLSMTSGEIYMALQRGTVDGMMGSYTTIYSRGLQEQLRYCVNKYAFDYHGPIVIAFKKDWWDKLPADVRGIIEEGGKAFRETIFKASMDITKEHLAAIKKHVTFVDLTPEGTEAFNKMTLPMHEWWMNRAEVGEPGKKLIELIRATEK